MRRMSSLLILSAAIALSLSACGGGDEAAGGAPGGAPGGGEGGPGGGAPAMQLPVEAVTVTREPLAASVQTVGTTRADESVVIRPEVAGRILRLPFKEGDRVAKGDELFALDDSVPRAAVNEAEATRVNAQRADKRAGELGERKLISQSEIDTLRSQLGVADARVASARATLGKYTLRAPFDGVIGLREVSIGEYVSPGQALVSLVRLDPMEVDFSLPESSLASVAQGQAVTLRVDAFPADTFRGEVAAIDPVIDINSRSAKLRARVDNPDHKLRPGLFARVSIGTGEQGQTGLLIPEQALMQQGDERFVYTVVDGKAKRTVIQTGLRLPGRLQVTSGLDEGDQVITAGQAKPMMFDGAGVMVVPKPGSTPAQAAPAAAAPQGAAPRGGTPAAPQDGAQTQPATAPAQPSQPETEGDAGSPSN